MRHVLVFILTFSVSEIFAETWPNFSDTGLDQVDSAIHYHRLGISMYGKGDFESSINYFFKSVDLKKQMNYEQRSIANTLMNIGVIYRKMWDYEKALDLLDQARHVYENSRDTAKIAITLLNKGNVYADLGDNQQALEQYKQSANLMELTDDENNASVVYNNMGSNYFDIKEYEKALEAFKQSIALLEQDHAWTGGEIVTKNIANVYVKLDSIGHAERFFQKGLQFYSAINEPTLKKGYFILDYGMFLFQHGAKEKGFSYINEAGTILRNILGEKHPELAEYYLDIGQLYLDDNNQDLALAYLQKALIALIPEFNDESFTANPGRTQTSSDIVLLGIFKRKSIAIYQKFLQTGDAEILEAGYQCALRGINILEDLRKGYVSEKSKLLLMELEKEIYPVAILAALKLYEHTGYENYKEEAFTIAERSKASALLTSLKTMEARDFGGIPEHLIRREYQLKKNIALYDEKLYEESKFNDPDSNKIKFWESKLYGLKNQYYNLIDTFEKDYPGYFELKYRPETISTQHIKNILQRDEALIEYCVYGEQIISFFVAKNRFDYHIELLDTPANDNLEKFIRQLNGNRFSNHELQSFTTFVKESKFFYKKLIAPYRNEVKSKSLIIIPDGQLAYLPFEVLVSDDTRDTYANQKYSSIPYLIRTNSISYAHSATLLFKAKASPENQQRQLIAFAPKYDLPENIPAFVPLFRQKYLNQLYPLPGSKEEVTIVQKIIGGQVFIDDEATEANFKKNAGDYDILHLAMHTVIDNDDPMFTKMVFTQTEDDEEDNFLNTYELYNMKLPARMAVLSSCNSGTGKLQKGEGVISLARGFMYAGCPSVTMSLWEVEDKSGAHLMRYYYENLKKGKSKSEALQLAKLRFLENADPLKAHPYFWSGFVVIGNHDPLFQKNRYNYLVFGIVILLIGGIIALYRMFIKSKRA